MAWHAKLSLSSSFSNDFFHPPFHFSSASLSFHSLIPHPFFSHPDHAVHRPEHSPHRDETSTDIATSAISVYNPHVCPPDCSQWLEGQGPVDVHHQNVQAHAKEMSSILPSFNLQPTYSMQQMLHQSALTEFPSQNLAPFLLLDPVMLRGHIINSATNVFTAVP